MPIELNLLLLGRIWEIRLAGAAGFEPANAGTKNRCLTTWRRPSRRERGLIAGRLRVGRGSASGESLLDPAMRIGRLAALDGDQASRGCAG